MNDMQKFYRKRVKLFIALFVLISVILLSASFYLRFYSMDMRSRAEEEKQAEGKESGAEGVSTKAPVFLNIPSRIVTVGEEYVYPVKVSDADTQSVDLEVKAQLLPSWLKFQVGVLRGIPTEGDIGAHEVILIVTDGENEGQQQFYVAVQAKE